MEIFTLDDDLLLLFQTAESFPEGVLAAHQTLHRKLENKPQRQFFGISYPVSLGKIVYHAAAECLPVDNPAALGCTTFTLKKGPYLSVVLNDYLRDIPSIGRTFQQLLDDPRLDPDGYCVEWYVDDRDVRCMVPIRLTNPDELYSSNV